MENIYYKAKLAEFNFNSKNTLAKKMYISKYIQYFSDCSSTTLTKNEQNTILLFASNYIEKNNKVIVPTTYKVDEIVNKKFKVNYSKELDDEIIYTIVYDENNNKYAKELISGCLNQIIDTNDLNIKNELEIVNIIDDDYEAYLIRGYKLNKDNILKLSFFIDENKTKIATINEVNSLLKKMPENEKKLKKVFSLKKEYINATDGFYKKMPLFKLRIGENSKDLHIRKHKWLSSENVYEKEIIIKNEKPVLRRKKDEITLTTDNIELLLVKLGKINKELKNEKESEYYRIINPNKENNLTLTPFNLASLKLFEQDLEFIISHRKIAEQGIISYLDSLIEEYNTNKTTPITIKEIDKLNTLFLQMKDKYEVTTQRKIMINLSLLYIYEIYENKDSINLEDLKNSYFNDNIKTILICLNDMIENNIIEPTIIDFDDVTIESVLNIIKNIKFIKNDQKVKKREFNH